MMKMSEKLTGFPFSGTINGYYATLEHNPPAAAVASVKSGLEQILRSKPNNSELLKHIEALRTRIAIMHVGTPAKPATPVAQQQPSGPVDVGSIIPARRVDAPRGAGGDYSFPYQSQRIFIKDGVKPSEGTPLKIIRVSQDGRFCTAVLADASSHIQRPAPQPSVPKPAPVASKPIPQPAAPAESTALALGYFSVMDKYVINLRAFTTQATESLGALTKVLASDLTSFTPRAREEWNEAKKQAAAFIALQLNPAYDTTDRQQVYRQVSQSALKIIETVERELTLLEKRAEAYLKNNPAANYNITLPSTEPVTIRQYQVTVVDGRRQVNIVFPETGLPGTIEAFVNYMRNEANFPERKDREVITSFLSTLDAGATPLYNGERKQSSATFTSAFKSLASRVTVEDNKPVKREAMGTEVRQTRGGSNGGLTDLLYR